MIFNYNQIYVLLKENKRKTKEKQEDVFSNR